MCPGKETTETVRCSVSQLLFRGGVGVGRWFEATPWHAAGESVRRAVGRSGFARELTMRISGAVS